LTKKKLTPLTSQFFLELFVKVQQTYIKNKKEKGGESTAKKGSDSRTCKGIAIIWGLRNYRDPFSLKWI